MGSSGRVAISVAAMMMATHPGSANELTIYSGGAVKSALTVVAEAFEKKDGAKITLEFHPMGPLTRKLADGAIPDVVVVSEEVLADLTPKALLRDDSLTEVGRVGIGVAVHENAPAPDISTPEALRRTLLNAKSIVYIDPARGTSGKHFAGVLERLGIAEAIKAKTTLGSGGFVVEPVGRGEIELGVHQITEILPVKGVKLVGPLPAALQKETVYVGAVTRSAKQEVAARRFLAYLRTPEVRTMFAERGFIEPR